MQKVKPLSRLSQLDYLDFVVIQVHLFSITKPVAGYISGVFTMMFQLIWITGTQIQNVPEEKTTKLLSRNEKILKSS